MTASCLFFKLKLCWRDGWMQSTWTKAEIPSHLEGIPASKWTVIPTRTPWKGIVMFHESGNTVTKESFCLKQQYLMTKERLLIKICQAFPESLRSKILQVFIPPFPVACFILKTQQFELPSFHSWEGKTQNEFAEWHVTWLAERHNYAEFNWWKMEQRNKLNRKACVRLCRTFFVAKFEEAIARLKLKHNWYTKEGHSLS